MKQNAKSEAKKKVLENRLYEAILQLRTPEECRNFFADLCTPAEIEAMRDRWEVVRLLIREESYRSIAAQTGVSLVTIGRVARFLNGEHKGYRTVLKRLEDAS